MSLLKVSAITIGMTIIGGLAGYEEGKRAHTFTKPTEADCAFYKLESQVSPENGATLTLACDPTWNKNGKPVCSQSDPLPQYTKPVDPVTYEGLTPPASSSDYHYGKVKPIKPIKTCAPEWDEPVKGTCAIIADGYIIPVEYPKHKAVKCQYLSEVDKSLCSYRLEDQP